MPDKKYITVTEAAKRLKTTPLRIARWVKVGRLAGKVERKEYLQVMVEQAALKEGLKINCLECGKSFKPGGRNRFCSALCKGRHANKLKKARAAKI